MMMSKSDKTYLWFDTHCKTIPYILRFCIYSAISFEHQCTNLRIGNYWRICIYVYVCVCECIGKYVCTHRPFLRDTDELSTLTCQTFTEGRFFQTSKKVEKRWRKDKRHFRRTTKRSTECKNVGNNVAYVSTRLKRWISAGRRELSVEEPLPVRPTCKKADKNCLPNSDRRRTFALLISIYL